MLPQGDLREASGSARPESASVASAPTAVDIAKLETYLSEKDFQEVFGRSREKIYAMPRYEQLSMKKDVGLW